MIIHLYAEFQLFTLISRSTRTSLLQFLDVFLQDISLPTFIYLGHSNTATFPYLWHSPIETLPYLWHSPTTTVKEEISLLDISLVRKFIYLRHLAPIVLFSGLHASTEDFQLWMPRGLKRQPILIHWTPFLNSWNLLKLLYLIVHCGIMTT